MSLRTRDANSGCAASNSAQDPTEKKLLWSAMAGGDFDMRYQSLLKAIDECVAILRSANETFFADWLENDRARIATGKTRALQHLLSAYGGMGSINDIIVSNPKATKQYNEP